jgi:hypothetical protein
MQRGAMRQHGCNDAGFHDSRITPLTAHIPSLSGSNDVRSSPRSDVLSGARTLPTCSDIVSCRGRRIENSCYRDLWTLGLDRMPPFTVTNWPLGDSIAVRA